MGSVWDEGVRGRRRWTGLRVVTRKATLTPGEFWGSGGRPAEGYGTGDEPGPFYRLSVWSLDPGHPRRGLTMGVATVRD